MMKNLVSIGWLREHYQDPDLMVLDASTKSNAVGLVVRFEDLQIEGARAFDFKSRFSNSESSLPNMMPTAAVFQAECQKLGIGKNSRIVVYDNLGIYSSPRVWWMFKTMGHENVAVLDGGLPAWKKADLPCEAIQENSYERGDFEANFQSDLIKSISQISEQKNALLIDARSKARFDGVVPEPRMGLKSGHIPGALNLPFLDVLEDGYFLSIEELSKKFDELGLGDQDLVFSCGSGVTACVLILAASLVSKRSLSLYDGSWSEWGQLEDAFIEK